MIFPVGGRGGPEFHEHAVGGGPEHHGVHGVEPGQLAAVELGGAAFEHLVGVEFVVGVGREPVGGHEFLDHQLPHDRLLISARTARTLRGAPGEGGRVFGPRSEGNEPRHHPADGRDVPGQEQQDGRRPGPLSGHDRFEQQRCMTRWTVCTTTVGVRRRRSTFARSARETCPRSSAGARSVRGGHGVLDGQVDPDPAGRGHGVRGVPNAEQPVDVPVAQPVQAHVEPVQVLQRRDGVHAVGEVGAERRDPASEALNRPRRGSGRRCPSARGIPSGSSRCG